MTTEWPGGRSESHARREPGASPDRDAGAHHSGVGASPAAFALLGLLALLGCLQVLIMLGVELDRLVKHHEAITDLRADVQSLEREAEGLRAIVEHQHDEAFREQLARLQGFVWPHEERIVVIPPEAR